MKNNKILLNDIAREIQTTNAFLGFIRESIAEGSSIPSREELDYVLYDIWTRNRAAVKALDELYKCI